MRKLLFLILRKITKPLLGKGYSSIIPASRRIFYFLYRHLGPTEITLAEVKGLKMYVDGRSDSGRSLLIKGTYEPATTKLFTETVKEEMTVLDLGANFGYYSFIAARQVGKAGLVIAFEPGPENLSLLQKGIEANGFDNVTVVPKAVSNTCGKQRLFLAQEPMRHSLYEELAGNESIEVDVTTVDEFVKSHDLTVDLVKMDVEGSETEALEGMKETIAGNQNLKLIIEFTTQFIEESGSSPGAFLETLMGFGFVVYLINEQKQSLELVTRDNMDNVIQASQGRLSINLYCERAG